MCCRGREPIKLWVATSKAYNSAQYVESNGFKHIYYTTQDRQSIGMLYKGRVDILIRSELVLQQLAEKYGHDFSKLIKLANVVELNNELSIAFSHGSDPALVNRFRQAYLYLQNSGELDQLRQTWRVYDDMPLSTNH